MPRINEGYLNLRASYLFAEIRRRQQAFAAAHPEIFAREAVVAVMDPVYPVYADANVVLADVQIVGAPGAGFGPSGEGYFRLTP